MMRALNTRWGSPKSMRSDRAKSRGAAPSLEILPFVKVPGCWGLPGRDAAIPGACWLLPY